MPASKRFFFVPQVRNSITVLVQIFRRSLAALPTTISCSVQTGSASQPMTAPWPDHKTRGYTRIGGFWDFDPGSAGPAGGGAPPPKPVVGRPITAGGTGGMGVEPSPETRGSGLIFSAASGICPATVMPGTVTIVPHTGHCACCPATESATRSRLRH